ncbi:TetR/AcrR family transcriptional regulator [Spirillospora albida]|uniref:TetR/AcrR family transcriptional regulator n=1 Tax=Spirillospora albida TaxID=58123 RepID=UPI0004BFDDE1|nr:TetR/AcrR family transcriptional regulator [Spirillospora albida]
MPKINAPTVREHRVRMEAALTDAAEEVLRAGGELTAGAVARRVGIARSSVYKYVTSVDDLIEAVVARDFPRWTQAVRRAVDAEADPAQRVLAYARANIAEGASGDHGWYAGLARTSLSPAAMKRIMALHRDLETLLTDAVRDLDARHPDLLQGAVQALVDAAVRAIDRGRDPSDVTAFTTGAVAALIRDQER